MIDTSAVYPLLIGWNEFVNQSDEPTLIKRIDLIKLIVALFKKFLDTLHTFKKALTKKEGDSFHRPISKDAGIALHLSKILTNYSMSL